MAAQLNSGYILGLDIGDARIGLAIMSSIAKLPRAIETIPNDERTAEALRGVIAREAVNQLVIGLPRNQEGLETSQSQKNREYGQKLAETVELPYIFVDESLSSKRADEYLRDHPKEQVSQDSLAACFILEEFLATMETR